MQETVLFEGLYKGQSHYNIYNALNLNVICSFLEVLNLNTFHYVKSHTYNET